jgi:phage N-6-adenine-methyltransferase
MTELGRTLTPLARAERMLAEIASAEDAINVINYAEAARVYAQRAGLSISSINYATAIKVCAEIKLAEVVRASQQAGQIAKHEGARGVKPVPPGLETLEDLRITTQRLSEARKMAKQYTPETIRDLARQCNELEIPLSRKQLLNGEAVQQSLTNEWYTPVKYLDAARAVLGGFDLDPASCIEANVTVKANQFYDQDDDGLAYDWKGRVWLNPPYGRTAGAFVERLVGQYEAKNVSAAVALVNAHCTDTSWFQRLWSHTLCFTDHRIDFSAGTDARSGSTHGSVFAYLGPEPARFAEKFNRFGAVVRRWP